MKDFFRQIGIAFGFLTVLPAPKYEWSEENFGKSAAFFPLTGLFIGGLSGAFFCLTRRFLPKEAAAALTLILWIVLSGGLHWDGVGDCFDGFCYAGNAERRLEIMKDSRMGTYGALGLICSLLLKFTLIAGLKETDPILLFALISALSRWGMLLLVFRPLANPKGMAAALRKACPKQVALPALIFPLIPAVFLGVRSFLLFIPELLCIGIIALTAQKKIGGISGDVLGLSVEIGEIVLLLGALFL